METILSSSCKQYLVSTNTDASAARTYLESGQASARAAGGAPPAVAVPVGFRTFPGEVFAAPCIWVEIVYPGLAYFSVVERGGHFAVWEEPALFASELRAAFKITTVVQCQEATRLACVALC